MQEKRKDPKYIAWVEKIRMEKLEEIEAKIKAIEDMEEKH